MSNFLPALAAMLLCAGHLADQDLAAVADALGRDVLVGAGVLLHRVDVHAALVGEGAAADVGLAGHEVQVGRFVDVPADVGEVLERVAGAGSPGRT